jgi:hypothetical protein
MKNKNSKRVIAQSIKNNSGASFPLIIHQKTKELKNMTISKA